jgi:hypothetical protein
MRRSISLAGLLALTACAGARLAVTDAGAALVLAPRPADCRVEFYRTKPPERPYDEVSTLHFSGRGSAAAAQEALRAKACELGADAVIVTRDYIEIPGQAAMTGTAVSYPDLREGHRVEHALRQAADRAAFEKALEAAPRPAGLPTGYVGARTKRQVTVRREPHAGALAAEELAAGQVVWVSPEPTHGYRLTAGGGYVDEDVLEFAAPARPAVAPPGPPPPAPDRTDI